MPKVIFQPSLIEAAGNKPKIIEEFIGRVNSKTEAVSIARMQSPKGWSEPPQTPEFDEYTVVLQGVLMVVSAEGQQEIKAGQALVAKAGERVQYSTPFPGGAVYLSVCLPGFSPDRVHRETNPGASV